MKALFQLTAAALAVACAAPLIANAAVSAEEAKQLGNQLTLFGAEKAGNKDGSIPAPVGVPAPGTTDQTPNHPNDLCIFNRSPLLQAGTVTYVLKRRPV